MSLHSILGLITYILTIILKLELSQAFPIKVPSIKATPKKARSKRKYLKNAPILTTSIHSSRVPALHTIENSNAVNASNDELGGIDEENLDALFQEALFRMSFFMETDYLLRVKNEQLQNLFQTCVDSVYIHPSTIPQAGRGLFAKVDIPKGTIIAFYPVHCIGLKFESGLCNSLQLSESNSNEDLIDVQSSAYALFSLANRELCGVDLQTEFKNSRLFVDMNPAKDVREGWYCGLINDAAVVRYQGDLEYYVNSRGRQNVEIVPFSTAPFQVGVTTKDIKADDELFVSYGYNYWMNKLTLDKDNTTVKNGDSQNSAGDDDWEPKPVEIEEQENDAMIEIFVAVDNVEEKYEEASWVLAQVFNGMNSEKPPPLIPPTYNPDLRAVEENDNVISRTMKRFQQFMK